LSALETLGLNKKYFGLHSLRSGGATAAAAAKVEDRLFKKHGRWRTDKAKDGYVKENISERLSVTQNIGRCTLVSCSYKSVVYFIYELI